MNTKKPYTKPRLRTIELETREVLGTGCKQDPGPTSAQFGVPNCGVSASCVGDGS